MGDLSNVEQNANSPKVNPDNKVNHEGWLPIEQSRVSNIATSIGSYFDLSDKVVKKGQETKAYYLSDEQYEKLVLDYAKERGLISKDQAFLDEQSQSILRAMGMNPEEIQQKKQKAKDQIIKSLRGHAGLYLHGKIFIKQTSVIYDSAVLQHEMIHALTSGEADERLGFQTSDGKDHYLNEGVTQTLQLVYQYNLPPLEMLNKIIDKTISTPYRPQVELILLALVSAEQAGKPMTYKEVAKYLLEGQGFMFKINLLGRGDDKFKEVIKNKFITQFGI